MFLNVLKACWQAWVLLHLVQVKSSPKNFSSLETNDRLGLTSYPGEATVFVGLVFTDVGTFPIRPRSDMDIILGIRSDDVDESDNKSPLNRVRSSFTPDVSGTWPYNTWYMHCIDTYSSLFFNFLTWSTFNFCCNISSIKVWTRNRKKRCYSMEENWIYTGYQYIPVSGCLKSNIKNCSIVDLEKSLKKILNLYFYAEHSTQCRFSWL